MAGRMLHGRRWTGRLVAAFSLWLQWLTRSEDFEAAKEKALKVGAVACYVEDIRREFIEELCFPAIQCNAIYENVYLLGELLRIVTRSPD